MLHRGFEWIAVCGVGALLGGLAWETWFTGAGGAAIPTLLLLALAACFAAQLGADLLSGLAHWLADRVLSESTPVLGTHFVKPFREHHEDPESITRHDFVEVNGNTCILVAPLLALATLGVAQAEPGAARSTAGAFAFFLAVWLCLTNQFHRWSHTAERPVWLLALERTKLVLARDHHARHHKAPFDTHFCITTGKLNPLIDGLGVFARLERAAGCRAALPDPLR